MFGLLYDLDRGSQALPPGSHVTFFTREDYESTVGRVMSIEQQVPRRFTVEHVRGDPLHYDDWCRKVRAFAERLVEARKRLGTCFD